MRNTFTLPLKFTGWLTAAALAAGLAGCAGHSLNTKQYSAPVRIKSLEDTARSARSETSVVPVKTIRHTGYVPLDDVARAVGYHAAWLKNGTYGVGDRDPVWTFHPGASAAAKAGQPIRLPAPSIKESDRLYVPVSGLHSLFGQEISFEKHGNSVSFLPHPVSHAAAVSRKALPFEDARSPQSSASRRIHIASVDGGNTDVIVNDVADSIIREAHNYLGIKYVFGTGPFESTHTFDCSSFTQYLFGKRGIDLPRTAREQDHVGKLVSRNQLQKGDLLFFTVPGRFKNDSIAGHVGIYMGNGQMIHSCPAPKDGVQISDINRPYWQDVFIDARRVLP